MTKKQLSKAVKDHELPDCVGNPSAPCPNPRQPLMIKGYDDQMRCVACNKLHIELVYLESGDSAPTTVSRNVVAPKKAETVQPS